MRILLINVYYTNFRGMQGHTVFLIIFGLLIAGESADMFFEVTDK